MRRKQRDKAGSVPEKAAAATSPDVNAERSPAEWLTPEELTQQYADLSMDHIRWLIINGTLPVMNIATSERPDWRILRSDFEAYEKVSLACRKRAILDLGKLLS